MKNAPAIRKVAICGFGLIGGCIALDLAKGRPSFELHAFDRRPVLNRLGRDSRFKVVIPNTLGKAVAHADIVILSATHAGIKSMLTRLARMKMLTDCLILDTGAVKVPTVRLAEGLSFPEGAQFISGHPMAGRERKGFQNADTGLFKDRAWYLDSEVTLTGTNRARLDWLLKKTGAQPVYIAAETHDEFVSEISHLPQLLSTILGAQIEPEWIPLAGPGLRSMLRLAGSPYSVWSEIIDENRQEIIKALDNYANNVRTITDKIKNRQSLDAVFKAAARSYKCSS